MNKKTIPFMTLAAVLLASPAFALNVKKSVDVGAAPAAAWKAIGDFCGIGNWHPAVTKCEISKKNGATLRTLTLKDGGKIIEKQGTFNNRRMSYSYSIVESPLPVANYQSTISVAKHGSGATITWVGKFKAKGADDAAATNVISGVYDAGLNSLKDKLK